MHTLIKGKVRRLFPLYCISLFLFVLFDIVAEIANGHVFAERFYSMSDLIISAFGVQAWVGENFQINGPTWYVSTLLMCYILHFIIRNLLKDDAFWGYVVAILVGLICMSNTYQLPIFSSFMGSGYFSFFIGTILAISRKRIKLMHSIIALSISVFFVVISFICKRSCLGSVDVICASVVAPSIIIIGENDKLRFLGNKFTGFLGNISYPMYLFHIPIFVIISVTFGLNIEWNHPMVILSILIFIIIFSVVMDKIVSYFMKKRMINV